MPSRDLLDELLRLTQAYKTGDDRRRVPIASLIQQSPGNAVALPKPAESGPEINEFAYLGTPSPPIEGTPGMPAMTRPPIKMPGLLDPHTAPGLPPGYSYWDDGSVRDPDGNPARFEAPSRRNIAKDVGTAAFPMAYKGARLGMDALGLAQKGGTALARGGQDLARDVLGAPGQPGAMDPNVPELPASRSHGGSVVSGALQGLREFYEHPGNVYQGKADPKDPAQAFNFATTMMTGGLGGVPRAVGEVVLGAGPVLPGTWWHDLSKNKLTRPVEEMSATRVPTTELAPRNIVTPADLQGEVMMPLVGDRTAAGQRLTAVNEQPLTHGVELQGGPGYMRANDALWASQKGAATAYQTRVNKIAEETGQTPLAVYTAMGPRGGDYSHMVADTIAGMLPSHKITEENAAAFKSAVRKNYGKQLADLNPENPEALRQQLLGRESGNLRKAFIEEMAKEPWQQKRFPDVASARAATIEPALLNDPTYSGGYVIGRTAPGQPTTPDPGHLTYSTRIPGKLVGGLEEPLPKELMWLDWYRNRRAQGATPGSTEEYTFRLQSPRQVANQEWVDLASEYLRRRKERAQ